MCVATNYIFQKQCFADICVHWGQYKTHLFLHHIQDPQVHETEHLLHLFYISIEWTYSPLVICNDSAFTEFVQGEERCLKFINQDLTFLQTSSILSTFSNVSHTASASTKAKDFAHIQFLTHISQENNTKHTQTIEPVLGFTPAEIP